MSGIPNPPWRTRGGAEAWLKRSHPRAGNGAGTWGVAARYSQFLFTLEIHLFKKIKFYKKKSYCI